jgi:CubicO group peptidase (beta-lactamase class C family)
VLRDYARLGLLLAHDGEWRGRRIIPASWMAEATGVHERDPHLRPGVAHPFAGYGYQVWLLPGARRTFWLSGMLGQAIFVDPASGLVMVQTAVRQRPGAEVGLWQGVVSELGR